jgi:nucleotide-binding universal stress UspA family protein
MLEERAERFLAEVSRQAESEGVQTTTVIKIGPLSDQILDAAKEADADVIAFCVQSAEPRSDADDAIETVLRSAEVPTLIVRPKETQSSLAAREGFE